MAVQESYYQRNKERIKQYYIDNKESFKRRSDKWRESNPERKKELDKKYSEKSKDYRKTYKINNKEKLKDYDKIWKKEKRNSDPIYKILDCIRVRINKAIKKGFKSKSTLELLGCDIIFLKNHIESKFKPEMNWENHGILWEIDHIIPCSSFDLSNYEQQKVCFRYTNLQPLFKTTTIAESLGYNEIGNRNKSNNHGSF